MPRNGAYTARLDLGLDKELAAALRDEAKRRGLSVADLVRRELRRTIVERQAIDGREALDAAIRRAIRPDVERLAKLAVHASMEASTALLVLLQVLEDIGRSDVIDIYNVARKKAASRLRLPAPDDEDADEEGGGP